MSFTLDDYGKVVSFDTYSVGHLGDIYQQVQILAILDYETARQYRDISAVAVAVYPTLPESTPKDFTKYKYLKVRLKDGGITVLALDWINSSTIHFHTEVEITIRVIGNSIDIVDRCRNVLQANNITVKEIIV